MKVVAMPLATSPAL